MANREEESLGANDVIIVHNLVAEACRKFTQCMEGGFPRHVEDEPEQIRKTFRSTRDSLEKSIGTIQEVCEKHESKRELREQSIRTIECFIDLLDTREKETYRKDKEC